MESTKYVVIGRHEQDLNTNKETIKSVHVNIQILVSSLNIGQEE